MLRRRIIVLSVLVAVVATLACAQPPDREMEQAQGAIDAARATGADQYAVVEFAAAQEALKRAHEAVGLRDFRLALNHALDSRERAQEAAKEAADRKATAHTEADRALTALAAAIAEANAAVKSAEGARAPARVVQAARSTITDAERRVQEARAAFDQGDYRGATSTASAATSSLAASTQDLGAAASRRQR